MINKALILFFIFSGAYGQTDWDFWKKLGPWSSWHILETLETIRGISQKTAKNPRSTSPLYLETEDINIDHTYDNGERWKGDGFYSHTFNEKNELVSQIARANGEVSINGVIIERLKETSDFGVLKRLKDSLLVDYQWTTFSDKYKDGLKRQFSHEGHLKIHLINSKPSAISSTGDLVFKQYGHGDWDREIRVKNAQNFPLTGACSRVTVKKLKAHYTFTNRITKKVIKTTGLITLSPDGLIVKLRGKREQKIKIDCK